MEWARREESIWSLNVDGVDNVCRAAMEAGVSRLVHTSSVMCVATGTAELSVPRARLEGEDGKTEEFRSEILPRYQRRTNEVDEAILGAYLAGTNTRRIAKALAPLQIS